jgi:hypothetical protein
MATTNTFVVTWGAESSTITLSRLALKQSLHPKLCAIVPAAYCYSEHACTASIQQLRYRALLCRPYLLQALLFNQQPTAHSSTAAAQRITGTQLALFFGTAVFVPHVVTAHVHPQMLPWQNQNHALGSGH